MAPFADEPEDGDADVRTRKMLIGGLAGIFAVYCLLWWMLTRGTANDPLVQIAEILKGSSNQATGPNPPRNLQSWSSQLKGDDLLRLQRANEALVAGEAKAAGRILWPLAARFPTMRPSISWAYGGLAVAMLEDAGSGDEASRGAKAQKGRELVEMALLFNEKDFRAHHLGWRFASLLKDEGAATRHYEQFLATQPPPRPKEPPGAGLAGFFLLVVAGLGLLLWQFWDQLGIREKFEEFLMGDEPAPEASPITLAGSEAPAPAVDTQAMAAVGRERKKSITAILSAEAFLKEVQDSFDKKNFEKGVDLCTKAIELNPSNGRKAASICLAEGIRLFEVGDYQNAKELMEVSLHFEPHQLEAHTCLGNCYIKLGDFDKAREQYEKVIEADPKNGDAYYTLGVCYQKINDHPRAKRSFQVAVQLKDHPNSHFYLAKLFESEKDIASAITHWKRFIELSPGSPQAQAAADRLSKLSALSGGTAS